MSVSLQKCTLSLGLRVPITVLAASRAVCIRCRFMDWERSKTITISLGSGVDVSTYHGLKIVRSQAPMNTKCYNSPAACCPLPAARCPLPAARCPLPAARCPLPAARCPLPAARCPYDTSQHRLPRSCTGSAWSNAFITPFCYRYEMLDKVWHQFTPPTYSSVGFGYIQWLICMCHHLAVDTATDLSWLFFTAVECTPKRDEDTI